jgi:hypothetical protein
VALCGLRLQAARERAAVDHTLRVAFARMQLLEPDTLQPYLTPEAFAAVEKRVGAMQERMGPAGLVLGATGSVRADLRQIQSVQVSGRHAIARATVHLIVDLQGSRSERAHAMRLRLLHTSRGWLIDDSDWIAEVAAS